MSLNYRSSFDEFRDKNNAGRSDEPEQELTEMFSWPSQVRNVCLVWPDGKKKFLNFAYLISGEYFPDEGTICLIFTSDTVLIKGSGLEPLFTLLLAHQPRTITCSDPRYNQVDDGIEMVINEITFSKKE